MSVKRESASLTVLGFLDAVDVLRRVGGDAGCTEAEAS